MNSPDTLIADDADAITNGFKSVFTLNRRGTCWAHGSRNIDKKLLNIKNEEKREAIRDDIWNLQLIHTKTVFDKGNDLSSTIISII